MMTQNVSVSIKETDTIAYIKITGRIDENANLREIQVTKPKLVINARDIEHINSCGVKEWVEWTSQFTGEIYLLECSPVLIMQANLLMEFLGPAIVISFFIPFYCEACANRETLLVETHHARNHDYTIPQCPQCGETMQYEVHEEFYLLFLEGFEDTTISPDLIEAIKNFAG